MEDDDGEKNIGENVNTTYLYIREMSTSVPQTNNMTLQKFRLVMQVGDHTMRGEDQIVSRRGRRPDVEQGLRQTSDGRTWMHCGVVNSCR